MIIDLTQSVKLKEICKISAIGHDSGNANMIEFEISYEALVGFATELIWLYTDMRDGERTTISTYPLKADPSPNQALGFYLTPNSPMFVFKVNSLSEEGQECKRYKEINIKVKNTNLHYNVREPDEENSLEYNGIICVEPYELSKKNLINIRIFDKDKKDVTPCYNTVIFEINHKGIKEFATMLLVLANNYKEGQGYQFAHVEQECDGYNLGVILVKDSIQARLRCVNLGTAYDYDSNI